MKLVMAIVSNDDANKVMSELIANRFMVTKLATTGGFLKSGNTTMIIGVDDKSVPDVVKIIQRDSAKRKKLVPNAVVSEFGVLNSTPMEVNVGGSTIFVLDVAEFHKL
ncbi:MAG: cyclic-di-AMP receptor [Erysipelotrichales bacterium]|nr:cyclic-di-AMP receptor [Erysipelotrichales bacterium]